MCVITHCSVSYVVVIVVDLCQEGYVLPLLFVYLSVCLPVRNY